jgi:ABC-2 type transport system ATP-binding protein
MGYLDGILLVIQRVAGQISSGRALEDLDDAGVHLYLARKGQNDRGSRAEAVLCTIGYDEYFHIWEYFNRLAGEGKTVLITTHRMDEAEKCQMVGYMKAGRMAAQGTPEEILRLAGLRPVLKLWLAEPEGDAAILQAEGYDIKIEGGVVDVRLESHVQIKGVLAVVLPLDMRLTKPKLEEAFLFFSEAA